jgi:drug/metabolite transporter (DMT)-like permease
MFSLKPIFIKQAYSYGINSDELMVLRMWFALPFYTLMLFLQRKVFMEKRQYILSVIGLGFLGYFLSSYLDLMALESISAQAERIILYAYPTVVIIIKSAYEKRLPSKKVLVSLFIVYSGILFLLPGELKIEGAATGLMLMVFCAITFAIYVILSKPMIERMGVGVFTSTAMVTSCLFTQINFIYVEIDSLISYPSEVYILTLALAFFSTVIPSYAMSAAIAKIGSEKVAIAGTTGPAFTVIFAVIILGESFSIYHALGLTLVLSGVYLLSKK